MMNTKVMKAHQAVLIKAQPASWRTWQFPPAPQVCDPSWSQMLVLGSPAEDSSKLEGVQ